MNKFELVEAMAQKSGLSKAVTEQTLEAFQDVIKESMAVGETVNMHNFLKFEVVEVAERTGHNPKTGDLVVIPAHKKVKCTVRKGLKDSVL